MSQQINLFNPALLKQKEVFSARTMAAGLALFVAGGVGLTLFAHHGLVRLEEQAEASARQLASAKTRQTMAQTEFAPRQKSLALEADITQAQLRLRSLHDIETILQQGALGHAGGFAEYFIALARQSRGDLWLTGVTIDAGGTQVGLQGRALEANAIPAYITRLTREPVMQGKSFGSLQISEPSTLPTPSGTADPARPAAPVAASFVEFSLQAAGSKPESPVANLANGGTSQPGAQGGMAR